MQHALCSRHLHRPLFQIGFGRLGEWIDRFGGGEEALLVREVDTCVQIQASTLSATKTVYPLAKPPKFDLEERSVQVAAAKMHVSHNFEVL